MLTHGAMMSAVSVLLSSDRPAIPFVQWSSGLLVCAVTAMPMATNAEVVERDPSGTLSSSTTSLDIDATSRDEIVLKWWGFIDVCAGRIATFAVELQVFNPEENVWQRVRRFVQPQLGAPDATQSVALLLPYAGRFRSSICATGLTGLSDPVKSCALSDGVEYDVTPPVAGHVCAGIGAKQRCGSEQFVAASSVQVRWTGFDDEQTGISRFSWAVGASSGSEDLLAWEDTGLWNSVLLPEFLAMPARAVHITVRCFNRAGLNATTSAKLVFDFTPPIFLETDDWSAKGTIVFEANSSITLVWPTVADSESGVTSVRLRVFRGDGHAALELDQDVSTSETGSVTFEAARHVTYTAYLHATNNAGLEASSSLRRVMHDPDPPSNGEVQICNRDGRRALAQVSG